MEPEPPGKRIQSELERLVVRLALRMAEPEMLHVIAPSDDSTIAVQIVETRLMRKRKYYLSFERFKGELRWAPKNVERSRLTLEIDTGSLACHDKNLRASKQKRVAEYTRDVVLKASQHPAVQFSTYQVSMKPIRGVMFEGVVSMGGNTRAVKVNAVITEVSSDRLQLEGDSLLRLSDFGIKPPSTLFGMIETSDQVLAHLHFLAAPTLTTR